MIEVTTDLDIYRTANLLIGEHGDQASIEAANAFMEDQYLFGTAYPIRALKESVDEFKALPFTPEAMDKALEENARRLLKL